MKDWKRESVKVFRHPNAKPREPPKPATITKEMRNRICPICGQKGEHKGLNENLNLLAKRGS